MNAIAKSVPSTVSGVQNSYAAFARVLVSKGHKKLKVVFGGKPKTDGKTLWLPQLPYDLNQEDLFLVRSDILHECGHLEDTDFEFFKEFGIKHGALSQRVLNAIEDVRIEVAQGRRHRGGEAIIRRSMVIMLKRGKARTGQESAAEALMTLCYVYGCVLRGWDGEILEAYNKAHQYLINHLGNGSEPLVDQLLQLLKGGYSRLRTTQDAGELALKVMEIFRSAQNQQNQDQSSERSKEAGDGDQSESSRDGEKSEKADSGEADSNTDSKKDGKPESSEEGEQSSTASKSDSKEENQDGDKQSGKKSGAEGAEGSTGLSGTKGISAKSGESSSLSQNIEEMLNTDPGEQEVIDLRMAVEELAEKISQGKVPEYRGKPLVPKSCNATSKGAYEWEVAGIEKVHPDRDAYRFLEQTIGSRAGALLSSLQMLLQTRAEEEVEITTRGRIAPGKLYRVGLDDNRIFSRREETVLPRAAVTVLTDLSGSMGGCIHLALQTLILLEKAMSLVGNATEYLGFGSKTKKALTIAKSFEDDPIVGKAGIGGLGKLVGGGTPLLEGLFEATLRLIGRQESRKFLFVITDGNPDKAGECREASLRTQASGVEVVYFLIGMKTPVWLMGTPIPVVEIPDANGLVEALMGKLKEMILK